MNPFNNNYPNLNASDRIRDKKSAHIYATAKKQFQTKRTCKKKNIRYYKNGKVRSNINYAYQNDLARGNILCNNCSQLDDNCGTFSKLIHINPVKMENSNFSEFNGGSTIIPDISYNSGGFFNYIGVKQSEGFPAINSDVSGTWDPSATSFKRDISLCDASDASGLTCMYGYATNLIDIPRNLDGSGITIDPSSLLFPTFCYKTNIHTRIKTIIVMRGTIDLSMNIFTGSGGPAFVSADTCYDNSYNQFINRYVQLVYDPGLLVGLGFSASKGLFYGIIKKICCLNKLDGIPWMDIHIEVNNISDFNSLNQIIQYKPLYKGPNWGAFLGPFDWAPLKLPWVLIIYKDNIVSTSTENLGDSVTFEGYFSDVNMYQGNCDLNLTDTNLTERTYMSCLEDKTKYINFT